MNKYFSQISFVLILSLIFLSCKDSGTDSEEIEIKIESISASVIARSNMPFSDTLDIKLNLVLSNQTEDKIYDRLKFLEGNIFSKSTKENLGNIFFDTPWDGMLLPGEQDEVLLVKADSNTTIKVLCGDTVYIKLSLYQMSKKFIDVTSPEVEFQCLN